MKYEETMRPREWSDLVTNFLYLVTLKSKMNELNSETFLRKNNVNMKK